MGGLLALFDVDSLEGLDRIPARTFWMRLMTAGTRQDAALRTKLEKSDVVVLGTVIEPAGPDGETLAHVTFRILIEGQPTQDNHVGLVTLRKFEGRWMALFSKEFKIRFM